MDELKKVVISNGAYRFHLSIAASEMQKRGLLQNYISCGYPNRFVIFLKKILPFLNKSSAFLRLLDRAENNIPNETIHSSWLSEFVFLIVPMLKKFKNLEVNEPKYLNFALKLYQNKSSKIIKNCKPDIYHFRSGFGGDSVKIAKEKGVLCICDHSSADPSVFKYLIENLGNLPKSKVCNKIDQFWMTINDDLELADHIIVNSDFVKKTLMVQGIPADKISTVYLGVDSKFTSSKSEVKRSLSKLNILYAGRISYSKGVNFLFDALSKINDDLWTLTLAGGFDSDILSNYDTFINKNNISKIGFVSRDHLRSEMEKANIFVFPSLSEGSARVVFEALSTGLYVITTENAGSIIGLNIANKYGDIGKIVTPGNSDSIFNELNGILGKLDGIYSMNQYIGREIANDFSQFQYGNNLLSVYKRIKNHGN